jgi:hypothetical protein
MKLMEPAMNFVARVRPKADQAVSLQPGMLESMVRRLYIRRFPQGEQSVGPSQDEAKRATRREKKKAAKTK